MNKGILKSSGNYLLFLNSGDYLCENVLEKVFSETHTEDILYGNMKRNRTLPLVLNNEKNLNSIRLINPVGRCRTP